MSTIRYITDDRGKRWAKAALIMFAEAVIFGIGVEVGKDIFRKLAHRREADDSPPPPPDDVGDDPGDG